MLHAKLIEHFENPRNVGELPPPAAAVDVTNPACGDMLRLSAQFDAGGRVEQARFRARGCTASIAAGSALTELMLGKSRSQLAALRATDVESAVGELQPASKHAAALCIDALQALLRKEST